MPIGYLSLVAVLLASGVVVVLIRSHRLESELKRYKNQVSSLQKRICTERKCYCISSQTKNILDQTSSLRQSALKYLEARCERDSTLTASSYVYDNDSFTNNVQAIKKCYSTIEKTNNIDILCEQKRIADSLYEWFAQSTERNNAFYYLFSHDIEEEIKRFGSHFNNMICRMTRLCFINYKIKYEKLILDKAKHNVTQKALVDLDTLREFVDMKADNYIECFNSIDDVNHKIKEMCFIDIQ